VFPTTEYALSLVDLGVCIQHPSCLPNCPLHCTALHAPHCMSPSPRPSVSSSLSAPRAPHPTSVCTHCHFGTELTTLDSVTACAPPNKIFDYACSTCFSRGNTVNGLLVPDALTVTPSSSCSYKPTDAFVSRRSSEHRVAMESVVSFRDGERALLDNATPLRCHLPLARQSDCTERVREHVSRL
jgi:hypothetical protein